MLVGHDTLAKPVCPYSELWAERLEKPEGGMTGGLAAQVCLALKSCVCCSIQVGNAGGSMGLGRVRLVLRRKLKGKGSKVPGRSNLELAASCSAIAHPMSTYCKHGSLL